MTIYKITLIRVAAVNGDTRPLMCANAPQGPEMSSCHYVSIARTNNAMAEYIFTIIAVFYFQADPVLLHSDFFLILIISAASWTVEIIFRTACVEPSGHQRGHQRTLSAGGH